ncbi:MAG: PTS sugar transporter subunit IIA [Acidobacteriota bacterium]
MVSVLILTHGGVAPELLQAARIISGRLDRFEALSLDWSDSFEAARQKVEGVLQQIDDENDRNQGIMILTDILGGTPFNVAMAFRDPDRVEIVSGVNLPMVVRLGCLMKDDLPLAKLADWIRDKGRASICSSSDLPLVTPPTPCEESDG